jgi:epoxyqueuosine reductase
MSQSVKTQITEKAKELGFDLIGFSAPKINDHSIKMLEEYIADKRYGDMEYMKEHFEKRADPKKLWENLETVICLGVNYYNNPQDKSNPDIGVFSNYAYGGDYHKHVKKMLKRLGMWMMSEFNNCEVKLFTDTAPILEKALAFQSGIGWQAKNSLITSTKIGNHFFLGEIFTNLKIEPDTPLKQNHCGKCELCKIKCPTKALDEDYKLDVQKCISYWTIEHKGIIPDEIKEKIGNRIYGCDDCLTICPWNKFAKITNKDFFKPREQYLNKPLSFFAKLDYDNFIELFKGTAIKRIGLNRFLRNVIIAMGNSKNKEYVEILQIFINHEDEIIKDATKWALEKIKN